jgi:hypothetical protein
VTKAKACKVVGQERKPKRERKCEGMNPHTPNGASTLGVKVLVDSQNVQKVISGVKTQWIRDFFYTIRKLLKLRCLK